MTNIMTDVTSGFAQSPLHFVGRHIALWNPRYNRFLQMDESTGDVGVLQDASANPSNLGTWRTWERFEVCDVGNGIIALYSTHCQRFIRVFGGEVNGHGGPRENNNLPLEWDSERLTVVPVMMANNCGAAVAFHSASHNRFIRMENDRVDAVSVGEVDSHQLPSEQWQAEHWQVVLHPLAPSNPHPEAAAVVGASTGAVVIGAIPFIAIGTVQAAGFSSAGIVAGSAAAAMMSAEAIAAGGSVAVGGTVATLQSVGAVGFASGLATGGIVSVACGGAVLLGTGIYLGVESFTRVPSNSRNKLTDAFPYRRVAIKAPNGKLLTVLGGGCGNWWFDLMKGPCYTGVVKADADHANWWEIFTVHPCVGEEGRFALQSHHGSFLCSEAGGGDGVKADRWQVQEWEKFSFFETSRVDSRNVKGHFQAWDGRYLTIDHQHRHFIANAEQASDVNTFEVQVIE